jgi:hypothetical protein
MLAPRLSEKRSNSVGALFRFKPDNREAVPYFLLIRPDFDLIF